MNGCWLLYMCVLTARQIVEVDSLSVLGIQSCILSIVSIIQKVILGFHAFNGRYRNMLCMNCYLKKEYVMSCIHMVLVVNITSVTLLSVFVKVYQNINAITSAMFIII